MPAFNYSSGDISHLTGGFTPASMADVQGPFTDIRTALNGNLDETNVPNLSAAFTTYKRLQRFIGIETAGGVGTLLSAANVVAANVIINTGQAVPAAYALELDPAAFNANVRATRLRLTLAAYVNATAPAVTFTATLQPISTYGGAAGAEATIASVGAAVSGSSVAIASPPAAGRTVTVGSDFNCPAAGAYVVVVNNSATAANSFVDLVAYLEMRQV